MVMIFCNFLMFYQIVFSPKKKKNIIAINEHSIYKLPHKLPNILRSQEIRKYQENLKTSQNYSLVISLPPKMDKQKNPKKQKLNFSFKTLFHINTRLCLKYLAYDFLCKLFFASAWPQAPSNLICLTILVTPKSLIWF